LSLRPKKEKKKKEKRIDPTIEVAVIHPNGKGKEIRPPPPVGSPYFSSFSFLSSLKINFCMM
jgi:hypothetical protein